MQLILPGDGRHGHHAAHIHRFTHVYHYRRAQIFVKAILVLCLQLLRHFEVSRPDNVSPEAIDDVYDITFASYYLKPVEHNHGDC